MGNFLNPDKAADLKARVLAGHSDRDVALALGVYKSTVQRYRWQLIEATRTTEYQVIRPDLFRQPRYAGGFWLDTRRRWNENDLRLLAAGIDLDISYEGVADTLGRAPKSLAWRAIELGMEIPSTWRCLVYTPRHRIWREPKVALQYPYIVKPDDRHADLLAVTRMVGRALPGREDVCQDVMLALWESKTSLAELRADPQALRAFVKSFRKKSFERSGYGVESIDATISGTDGDRPKYEAAGAEDALLWMRTKVQ